MLSATVQPLIKVSQSIAERDESNQRSPTQSPIVEAKLRLGGTRLAGNRTILRYRRSYTWRAKTFLSFERFLPPNLLVFSPASASNLKSRFLFVEEKHKKRGGSSSPVDLLSGLSRSRREELFSLNNTREGGDKRDPVCCERFRLLEKTLNILISLLLEFLLHSFRFVVSSPIKVFESGQ